MNDKSANKNSTNKHQENKKSDASKVNQKPLKEGEDYYFENGLMVLTGKYLKERGFCCGNGCRHCPW